MKLLGSFLLLTSLILNGQQRPRRAAPPDTIGIPAQPAYSGPKGSVSGIVVDSINGAPIRKAQVRLSNFATVLVTDASGAFTFDEVPPGFYVLSAQHPAYPASPALGFTPPQFTLAAGEQRRGVDVKLTPAASLSGHIADDDGDPLPNCTVTMFRQGPTAQIAANANTNTKGDFNIAAAPAGKYYLEARCLAPYLQPRPFAPPNAVLSGPQLGYASRFYPGTADLSGAQKIAVQPGQELRGLDFRMTAQPVYTVTVHVAGIEAAAAGRVMVSLVPQGAPNLPNAPRTGMVQPRTGLIQIGSVPPGAYTLRVMSFAPERAILLRQQVQIGDETRELTVQVTPPQPLTGMLRTEIAASAPPAQPPSAAPSRIWLSQLDEQGLQTEAEVKSDNTFTFRAVGPGRYRVSTSTGAFVQSVMVGGASFDGPEFELKPGASGPLEVSVGTGTGIISGDIVTGSSRPSRIMISAATYGQRNAATQLELDTVEGQSPHYKFNLPPGRYTLFALERTGTQPPYDLFSDFFASRGETVEVRSGAETARSLKLITAEEIAKADQ